MDIEKVRMYQVLNDIISQATNLGESIFKTMNELVDEGQIGKIASMGYALKPEVFTPPMTESDQRAALMALWNAGYVQIGVLVIGQDELFPHLKTYDITFNPDRIKKVRDQLSGEIAKDEKLLTKGIDVKMNFLLEIDGDDILYGGKPIDFKNYPICKRVLKYFIKNVSHTVRMSSILSIMDRGKDKSHKVEKPDKERISRCIHNINKRYLRRFPATLEIVRDRTSQFEGYKFVRYVKPKRVRR